MFVTQKSCRIYCSLQGKGFNVSLVLINTHGVISFNVPGGKGAGFLLAQKEIELWKVPEHVSRSPPPPRHPGKRLFLPVALSHPALQCQRECHDVHTELVATSVVFPGFTDKKARLTESKTFLKSQDQGHLGGSMG